MPDVKYLAATVEDILPLYRDRLRQKEAEHARLEVNRIAPEGNASALPEDNHDADAYDVIVSQIKALQAKIKELEAR